MRKSISRQIPTVDFDLRHLEVFRKVVELRGFSKAADAVFLAQASVSEKIATLENMIGARLLDRLGRQVVPTKAGEILYRHAIKLLDMKRTACLEMQDFLGVKQGELNIGGSTIPGEYVLPRLIERFREDYPLIRVTLAIADTSAIEVQVLEGELELAVVGSKSPHGSLERHRLWKDELFLAIPASHSLAKKREVSIEELAEQPFILRESGSGTLKIMEDYLQRSRAKGIDSFHVVARFGSSTAVKEGIKAGLGVSILSSKALDTELKSGILKTLRVKGLPMSREFYLIRDKRRTASPLCQAMLEFLLSCSDE